MLCLQKRKYIDKMRGTAFLGPFMYEGLNMHIYMPSTGKGRYVWPIYMPSAYKALS